MTGTLLLPIMNRLVGGVVLVHGSGPSQRNETIRLIFPNFMVDAGVAKPSNCNTEYVISDVFTQIAENLAANGFAVLRYDKRNCLRVSGIPGCHYELCNRPGQDNCVDFLQLSVNDFVTDASNAVKYLQKNWPSIDKDDITVIGHSQGCSAAPYVANQVAGVKRVVQLAGIGVPIDEVLIGQLGTTISSYSTGLGICKATNGPKAIIDYYSSGISGTATFLQQCETEFPKIRAGYYNRTDLVQIGGTTPAGFWIDWLKWGDIGELWKTMSSLSTKGVKVLAINSPSDQQVWQQFYQPLHAFVQSIPNSEIHVIPGLTHLLTPSTLANNRIDSRVLNYIVSFLQD